MNQSTVRVTQPTNNYLVRSIKLVSVTAVPLVLASIVSKPVEAQSTDEFDRDSKVALEREKIVDRSLTPDCDDSLVEPDDRSKQCDRTLDSQNSARYSPKVAESSQLAVRSNTPTYTYTAPEVDSLSDSTTTQSGQSFSQTEEEFIQEMTASNATASASRQSVASSLITPPIRQSEENTEVASVSYIPSTTNHPTSANTFSTSQPATSTPTAGSPQYPVAQSSPSPSNNYLTAATNSYPPAPNQYGYNAAPNPLLTNPTPANNSFSPPPQPATPTAGYPQYPVAQSYPTAATNPYQAAVPSQYGYNAAPNPLLTNPTPTNNSFSPPPQPTTPTAGYPQYPVAQSYPTAATNPYQAAVPSQYGYNAAPNPLLTNPTPANNSFSPSPQSATPTTGYPQYPVAQSYPTPATNPYQPAPNQYGYNAAPNPLLANPTPANNSFSTPQPSPYAPPSAISTPTTAQSQSLPEREPTVSRRSVPPSSTNLQSSDLLERDSAIGSPILQFQGASVFNSDDTSARGRVTAAYPVSSNVFIGGSLDLTEGNAFADSRAEGLQLNEMYLAASLESLPNLRFSVGQLDLTSYFDRNSFAKDGATHFFNPAFQSNPALSVSGLGSRLGALVNWSVTDNLEAKAATFSSARGLDDFQLDAFAGEVGLRYGNAIVRGTYATGRDAGSGDGFEEVFLIGRDDNSFGVDSSDREESYGLNAEVFVPNLKLGLFGRYGWYNNLDLNEEAETYSLGFNFLDLITPADRLGVAYGRRLSNDRLRSEADNDSPDVLEAFYDFRFLSKLRLGFSVQAVDGFSDALLGVRVKTEFDGFAF